MQPCPRLVGLDRGIRRDTAKDRIERKEREKKNGGWWNEQREQRWTEYCEHCWKWGHKTVQCFQWQGRRPIELRALVSNPSQSVVSDPGSSVSQRSQAVNSPLDPPVCWSTAAADVDEDWPQEWCYDWESDWMENLHEDWS